MFDVRDSRDFWLHACRMPVDTARGESIAKYLSLETKHETVCTILCWMSPSAPYAYHARTGTSPRNGALHHLPPCTIDVQTTTHA